MLVLRLENFVIKLIKVLIKNLTCVQYHTETQKFQTQHVSGKYVCAMTFATWPLDTILPYLAATPPQFTNQPPNLRPTPKPHALIALEFVLPSVLILFAINSSEPKESSPCTSHLSKWQFPHL